MSIFAVADNVKGLWKLGNLKPVRPNVRPIKLLIFNYLQMYNRFPSAQTKAQKNYKSSITSVRPNCHKPMLAVVFIRPLMSYNHCFVAWFCLSNSVRVAFEKVRNIVFLSIFNSHFYFVKCNQ